MSNLTELLLLAGGGAADQQKRLTAEQQLQNAEATNPEEYFVLMAQELAGNDKPKSARQLAGLMLKNSISSSKNAVKDQELKERWLSMPEGCRSQVKDCAAQALTAPELEVGKAAAQVMAKVGGIELPKNMYNELNNLLLHHVQNTDWMTRRIALVTCGYLCEELVLLQEDGTTVSPELTSKVLTTVVQGMKDGNAEAKLEATHALYHALVLAQTNFRTEHERNQIMHIVVQTCQQEGSEKVQAAAFECLVQIATEYYDFLLPYLDTVGNLTLTTIQKAPENVAIPAMEFWSTICDEELYIADLVASGDLGNRRSLNLISTALPLLIPLLMETLTKQQSEEDDDTWNLAMAAGTCLCLVSQVVGDACVDLVGKFVEGNFANPDWKHREAAVLAWGSIMEGPSSAKMQPMVHAILPHMVMRLDDQSPAVRDTTSWTLGRTVQFHPTIVPPQDLIPRILPKLQDVPRVAANICWVIQVLAESQPPCIGADTPQTTPLSEFFPSLAGALLNVVQRRDAEDRQLRSGGYNALCMLCSHAANDCLGDMSKLALEMLNHLDQSFGHLDKECELPGLICGVLTALVQRLREHVLPIADQIMDRALKVLVLYQSMKNGAQVLQEEALLLITAMAIACGSRFYDYMPHFKNWLHIGLRGHEEVQVCLITTGVIGDLCRALEGKIVEFCPEILAILDENLNNRTVDRRIKAAIIPCFGDLALAITGAFETYLGPVVVMLSGASRTKLQEGPVNDQDWIDYLNTLREGVLEAYTGIIHGLREANKLHLFKPHVVQILDLVKQITEESITSEAVMKASLGVVGDLVLVFQAELIQHLGPQPWLRQLVECAEKCQDPRIRQTSEWLRSLLVKYGGGP